MEKRVKIFFNDNYIKLEKTINDFLEFYGGKLHDIKFTHSCTHCPDTNYLYDDHTVLLIYTPEE